MVCQKVCKSSSGLKNHTNRKHGDSDSDMDISDNENITKTSNTGSKQITQEILLELLKETCMKLENSNVYSSKKSHIVKFREALKYETCQTLNALISTKVKFKNSNAFMTTYYAYIVHCAKDIFPEGAEENISKLILIKLSDLLLVKHQNLEHKLVKDDAYNISSRQLAGLQYLSGYVIHRSLKKMRNSPKWNSVESQLCINILEATKEDNENEKNNQKLVSALSRGGLCHVTKEAQQIFMIAEKYFLRKTAGKPNPSIKIEMLISDVVSFSHVKDLFIKISNKVDADTDNVQFKEAMKSTLYSIIQLYLRVRMFSLVKDYVQQDRIKRQRKAKEKSLRRSLKKQQAAKVSTLFFYMKLFICKRLKY